MELTTNTKQKRKLRFPILAKTSIIIAIAAAIIVEIAMTYYSLVMANRNNEYFVNASNSLSGTIAKVIDEDKVEVCKNKVFNILDDIHKNHREDIYISNEDNEERMNKYLSYYDSLSSDTEFTTAFNSLRTTLRTIVDANSANYIDCSYLSFVYAYQDGEELKGYFVYIVDSAPTGDDCPPGWLDPIFPINQDVLIHPERGFPAYTTDTGYGRLMTAGQAIKKGDDVVGYAVVDLSLDTVRALQASSITRLFIYLLVTVVLLGIIAIILVYFLFTRPIKKLVAVSMSFNKYDPLQSHSLFEDLHIKTRDEVNDLSESIKTMENSVCEQITNLTAANEALVTARNQTYNITQLANKDPLTGVQSKIAYHTKVDELNKMIQENKVDLTFGMAMIDLNYLKYTNDLYGHTIGDECLIKLAHTICLTFKHSPVYRFGGDEFVVILSGEDYKNSNELIEEFMERIEESVSDEQIPRYKRISAAIGYAEYDKEADKSVDDIFNRADQNMYICKHKMKESGH